MNQEELAEVIRRGESRTVEFKGSFDKETIETVSAFSNTDGGRILIGVSDNGEVKGVQIGKETLKGWANDISQGTEPRVISEIEMVEHSGKSIVVVGVKEAPLKPISVRGRCFIRVDKSNRVMTPQDIAEMHYHSTGMSWDKIPVSGASLDIINMGKVRGYMDKARASRRKSIGEGEKPTHVLEKLQLVKDGKPTWAAILLFSREPQRFLSQAVVHCGKFKDPTMVIDDRMIGGTIAEQVEEAMDFIRKNISVKLVMTGRPEREEVWDYPLEALREALINALCHRDYTIPSNTEIRIYDTELTIWNPGGLPLGMSMERLYKPHSSILRNKGIGEVLYEMGLIEQWGSGVEKMRTMCAKAGLPEPSLEERQDGFQVTFRKDIYTGEYLRELGFGKNCHEGSGGLGCTGNF